MSARVPARLRPLLSALVAALLVFAPTALAAPVPASAAPAASAPSADGEATGPRIEITELSDSVTGDGELVVAGRIIAGDESGLADPTLTLARSRGKLTSQDALVRWRGDHSTSTAVSRATTSSTGDEASRLPTQIEAGDSADFRFAVPAADLHMPNGEPARTWGALGLSLGLAASSDDGHVRIAAPAFTTWYPDPGVDPTKIAVVLPLTSGLLPDDGGPLIPPDALDAAADPHGEGPEGGSLPRALDAAKRLDTAVLAVDPRLIASVEAALAPQPATADGAAADAGAEAPENPAPDLTDTPADDPHAALRAWYRDLIALLPEREVVALPWADADLADLRAQGLTELAEAASASADIVTAIAPDARTDIGWPVADMLTSDQAQGYAEAGDSTVIVSDRQLPSTTGYTSSSRSPLPLSSEGIGASGSEALGALVADSGLARAAAAEAIGRVDGEHAPGELLALAAAITDERPFDSRTVLLTLPRTSAGSGLPDVAEGLAEAPWLAPVSLADVLDSEPIARTALVEPADIGSRPAPEPAPNLTGLAAAQERGRSASGAFADAEQTSADVDRALLACASAGRVIGGTTGECAQSAESWVSGLVDGITPEQGSSVLLVTGESTNIPIRVENATDRTAQIRVRVVSPTPQLSTESSEPITVEPHESTSVDVPVRGLANADVRARVEILTASGDPLPNSTELLVRVRADWENIGTLAIASVLVVVLVFGLAKSVRRGRRKIPKSQLDAAMARMRD